MTIESENIDEMRQEIEKLRALRADLHKNLTEARARIKDLEADNQKATGDLTALRGDFNEYKARDAWSDFVRHSGALPDSLTLLRQHMRLTIEVGEDGAPCLVDSEGKTLLDDEGAPLSPANEAHVRGLTDPIREALPMLWPRPQGAGQTGDGGRSYRPGHQEGKPAKAVESSFGLR